MEDLGEKVSEKVRKRCPQARGAEALTSRPAEHRSMGRHRAQHLRDSHPLAPHRINEPWRGRREDVPRTHEAGLGAGKA